MTVATTPRLFIHVEEPSMKEAVEAWLPQLLAGRVFEASIIDHGSKFALLKDLPARLAGYARWSGVDIRVLALVDRDDGDCADLKRKMEEAARSVGLATKTAPDRSGRFTVVNRVVVEELEAWFLGDVQALCRAYPGVPPTLGSRARFRDPDNVKGGTWEALLDVLNKAGHYKGARRLPKIEVARRVAPLMRLEANSSGSFKATLSGLDALLAT